MSSVKSAEGSSSAAAALSVASAAALSLPFLLFLALVPLFVVLAAAAASGTSDVCTFPLVTALSVGTEVHRALLPASALPFAVTHMSPPRQKATWALLLGRPATATGADGSPLADPTIVHSLFAPSVLKSKPFLLLLVRLARWHSQVSTTPDARPTSKRRCASTAVGVTPAQERAVTLCALSCNKTSPKTRAELLSIQTSFNTPVSSPVRSLIAPQWKSCSLYIVTTRYSARDQKKSEG